MALERAMGRGWHALCGTEAPWDVAGTHSSGTGAPWDVAGTHSSGG
ncbi:hypothetical protein M3G15_00705 [Paenibacillus sp. p3-SID1389]|nr:hypothetical protein [Paenibacillus sp. p3-SID1389]MCT2193674.1 hypothetical protein [Paenibacillus sp. p3-SID1389]